MPPKEMDVVVWRQFDVDGDGEPPRLLFSRPRRGVDEADWICEYYLEGMTARPRAIHGVDPLHSLQQAMSVAAKELEAWNARRAIPLTWCDGPAHEGLVT